MSTRTLLCALVCLIALSASIMVVRQQLLLQQLRESLTECRDDSNVMRTRVAQLEENLQSAGHQMDNLSEIIQEATRRAAVCEAERGN